MVKLISTIVLAAFLGVTAGYFFVSNESSQKPRASGLVTIGDFSETYEKAGTNVVMYSISSCEYCSQARALLKQKGIPFTERVIDKSAEAKEEVARLGTSKVPTILIGNYKIVGFNKDKILLLLDKRGN